MLRMSLSNPLANRACQPLDSGASFPKVVHVLSSWEAKGTERASAASAAGALFFVGAFQFQPRGEWVTLGMGNGGLETNQQDGQGVLVERRYYYREGKRCAL